MAATGVAVLCYWDGRVKTVEHDVVYEGDNMKVKPMKLNHGTNYAGLLNKVYATTGIDRWDFEMNIICRFPVSSREYKPVPIENDEAVQLMLEVPIRSGVFCVEIYLEKQQTGMSTFKASAPADRQTQDLSLFLAGQKNADRLGYINSVDDIQAEKHEFTIPVGYSAASSSNLAMHRNYYIGETSFRRSNNGSKNDHSKNVLFSPARMEGRKWEEPETDFVVNALPREVMESLLLEVPCDEQNVLFSPARMEGRKWEELDTDCLVNVFRRVGMESLLLDVPFVCKSWYKVSLDPRCWEHIIFPKYIQPTMWEDSHLGDRLMEFEGNFSVTAFIKSVVARSQRRATQLKLPNCCTEEALQYAANESPSLKGLGLYGDLLRKSTMIPKLICKWENLEFLFIETTYNMVEILAQISLHCKKFITLCAPGIYIELDQATAIVTSLPNLKDLVLRRSTIEREYLVIILKGCRELQVLDVRNCIGFDEDDAEILELASHIPKFMCKGSMLYDYEDEYDGHIDADFNSDCYSL